MKSAKLIKYKLKLKNNKKLFNSKIIKYKKNNQNK